jgi:hypothetical protein
MSTIKSRYKLMLYQPMPQQVPQLKTIQEIEDMIVEETIRELNTVKETLNDPGVQRKLDASKNSSDNLHEILSNKFLKEPVINDPDLERAKVEIPCGASHIDLTAVVQGVAGNAYTVEIIEDGENTELSCDCSEAGVLVINLATDDDGVATTIARELKEKLRETENYSDLFLDSITGDADNLVEAMTETSLSGGADGHKLQSTSEEIDNAVAAVQTAAYGAISPIEAATLTTGSGENWEIKWDAVETGAAGNLLALTITNGVGNDLPITVSVEAPQGEGDVSIVIALATDENGDPDDATNTATAVVAAVNEDAVAGLLIQGTLIGSGGLCATESKASLTGGSDGTPGVRGALRFDGTKLYVSVDESTTAVSNWKYVTLT